MMAERDWLYEMLDGLRKDQREQATQFRLEMNAGLEGMRGELRVQNGRVRQTEDRLTVIETERREEDKQAVKRGVFTGLVASTGLTVVIKLAERLFAR